MCSKCLVDCNFVVTDVYYRVMGDVPAAGACFAKLNRLNGL